MPSRVEYPLLESRVLIGNPLDDPHTRHVAVYLPPGYDDDPARRFPAVYLLSSHGSTGPGLMNWRPWDMNIQQQLDALMAARSIGPLIVVLPDMWTRFGGSQFINSAGTGRYEDYLVGEIIPFVDGTYRTLAHRAHRGVLGRSSGGFGALTQAMHHPELFGGFACHSGDLYWEYTCLPGISKLHQALERAGGLDAFIRDLPLIRPKGGAFWELVMTICFAAAFGGNPANPHGFDLPIDANTGALEEAVWARWLAHDPVRKVDDPGFADALRQMRVAYIDVGQYDEYQLQVGARLLHRKLEAQGIAHIFQEYPDGHRDTHYRYAESLVHLYEGLR